MLLGPGHPDTKFNTREDLSIGVDMETCSECGRKFDLAELIDTGFDDDGGEIFTIWLCLHCAEEAEYDQLDDTFDD